jgi:hypothetical protein
MMTADLELSPPPPSYPRLCFLVRSTWRGLGLKASDDEREALMQGDHLGGCSHIAIGGF